MLDDIYKNKDIIKLLLKAGADINAKDNHGTSALQMAANNGHVDIVRFLLKRKVDSDSIQTALWCAAANDHTDVVKLLKEYGAKD